MFRQFPRPVFCLDFDGVLCDSAPETAVSAWRAAGGLFGWSGREPPGEALERFVRLRPVIETGYQAPLLMALIVRGMEDSRILAEFSELCRRLMAEQGLDRPTLVHAFGDERDRWIRTDLSDWLRRHRFYPGVVPALRRALAQRPVFILTTKQERFALRLLESAGIDFPRDHLFGFDAGRRKEELLRELRRRPEDSEATFLFVEDRLRTLERVAGEPDLEAVRLVLARWGYVTEADLARAEREYRDRIQVWELERFRRCLSDCR